MLQGMEHEEAARLALPPPPAIASVGTQEPMVRRLFPGGKWIRTLGPPRKKTTPFETTPIDPRCFKAFVIGASTSRGMIRACQI